jgi:hypothetical protein
MIDLGPRHQEALCGEDVAHLGGSDAKGDGSEGAMGRGVAVAAGDGHAGLGETQLGPDDVHHALLATRGAEEADPGLLGVALEGDHHLLGQVVGQRSRLVVGGDDVVDGCEGALGEAHRQTQIAKHREGLGARDLVDEVQPDEELCLPTGKLAHRVCVPDLVEEVLASHMQGRGSMWSEAPAKVLDPVEDSWPGAPRRPGGRGPLSS